jgi:hypothetical protein
VALNGDDEADGSQSAPWRTLQRAFEALKPGDTLQVRGGVYNQIVSIRQTVAGDATGPITVRAASGERVIIDGAGLQGSSGIVLENTHHWIFRDLELRNFDNVGISLEWGCRQISIRNCRFRFNDVGLSLLDVEDFEIAACDSAHNSIGVNIHGARNGRFLNVHCHHNIGFAIDQRLRDGDGFSIDNYGGPTNGLLFEDCWSFENNEDGFDTYYPAIGDVTFRRCFSFRNGEAFFSIYAGEGAGYKSGRGSRFENCVAAFNRYAGFDLSVPDTGPAETISLRNCVAYGNAGQGVSMSGPGTFDIANSIIALNNREEANAANRVQIGSPGDDRYTLKENDNLVFAPEGLIRMVVQGSEKTYFRADLDGGAYAQETGNGTRTRYGDPLFADPEALDFSLRSGSPAIDRAATGGPATDVLCNARVDVPDVSNGPTFADLGVSEFGGGEGGPCVAGGPEFSISVISGGGQEGEVQFQASPAPELLFWNLGDGASARESAVRHHYAGKGTFEIVATAFDEQGRKAKRTKVVTLQESNAPIRSLRGDGSLQVATDPSLATAPVHYAQVSYTKRGSLGPPFAGAILQRRSVAGLTSEAGVLASPLTTKALVLARRNGGERTGVAVANPHNSPVRVALSALRGDNGQLAAGPINLDLGARQQAARFVDELFSTLPDGFEGAVQLESPRTVAMLTLRTTSNERGDFLFSTCPVADLAAPASEVPLWFPHLADGQGYSTEFVLFNSGNMEISGRMEFRDSSGPLSLTIAGRGTVSELSYTIPARSILRCSTDGGSAVARTGFAQIIPSAVAPLATALIRRRESGVLVSEAGVNASPAAVFFRLPVRRGAGEDTGVAIVNLAEDSSGMLVELLDENGAVVDTAEPRLTGREHTAQFVSEIFPTMPAGFVGQLVLRSMSRQVAVIGLRTVRNSRGEFVFSTIPVIGGTSISAGPALLPHLVTFADYRSIVSLLSGSGTSDSRVQLDFWDPSGAPMAAPIPLSTPPALPDRLP